MTGCFARYISFFCDAGMYEGKEECDYDFTIMGVN